MEPIQPAPRRTPWGAIVLAILAIVALVSIKGEDIVNYALPTYEYDDMSSPPPYPSMPQFDGYRGGNGSADITDTREFLKTYFSADIKTRQVPELTRRVEVAVRGFDGRVDETNTSEERGYVRFVVPLEKYEDFRAEIESFVSPRFISITERSENKLGEKQNIEERQESVETDLATLKANRAKAVSAHAAASASLQGQISANDAQSAALAAEETDDSAREAQIASQLSALASSRANLVARLNAENASHAQNLKNIDSQIAYQESSLDQVKEDDTDLMNSIATVEGTVSLDRVSLWEIAQLYLPGYWIPGIIAIIAVIMFLWERRRGPFARFA